MVELLLRDVGVDAGANAGGGEGEGAGGVGRTAAAAAPRGSPGVTSASRNYYTLPRECAPWAAYSLFHSYQQRSDGNIHVDYKQFRGKNCCWPLLMFCAGI